MPIDDARVPLDDRGHLLGDGVFETLRTYHGRPCFLEMHADRLRRAVAALGVEPAATDTALKALTALVSAAVPQLGPDLRLRIQVTTGRMDSFEGSREPWHVTAIARPLEPPVLPHGSGLRVVFSPYVRSLRDPLGFAKTLSFLPFVQARRDARRRGADDAILLNEAGRVCEATTSNVVAITQGRIYAPGPEEGAVDGITRKVLLGIAKSDGLEVHERLERRLLEDADEVLLTNSTSGVRPVVQIEGTAVGLAGSRGPWYERLSARYLSRLHDVAPALPVAPARP